METRLKIHYSFYIFLFFTIYFNGFYLFFSYFISLFIHEYSHYLLSKKHIQNTKNLIIYPSGMCLHVNNMSSNNIINFLIYLIGPLSNIILLLITMSLWWLFPVLFFYTREFVFANFILGFFNLIPIYPLDGGNMIFQLINSTKVKLKIINVMKIFSIISAIVFLILFIMSCFYTPNFSCFTISFFMFSSLFSYKNIIYDEIKNKFNNKVKEHKAYIINYNTTYEDIKKCFDNNSFVQFYLVNDSNKIVKIFSQEDVEKIFLKHFNNSIT